MIFEEGAISWQVKGHVLQLDGQQMGQGPFLRVAGGVGTTSICRPPSRLLPVGPSSSVAATSISFLPPHAGAAAALAVACISTSRCRCGIGRFLPWFVLGLQKGHCLPQVLHNMTTCTDT